MEKLIHNCYIIRTMFEKKNNNKSVFNYGISVHYNYYFYNGYIKINPGYYVQH